MFAYFYQACAVIFFLQGVATPFLMLFSGVLWWKQSRRLESLKKDLDSPPGKRLQSDEIFDLTLKALPKLRPLNCISCSAGLVLHKDETFCPHCHSRGDLPEDYAEAGKLKREVKSLLKSAVKHWRVANVLAFPPVRWIFVLMIFCEPLVIFPTVLIGANVFPNTWIDKAFGAMGETTSFVIGLAAFLGFIIWMVVFICLAGVTKGLRRDLPVVPVLTGDIRGSETANCEACGGGIEYDAGDFVCLCSYCNVENFRVQFVRRELVRGEKQMKGTKTALFGALEILEDFVGTFFFVLAILVVASLLLAILSALKS